jgi:hypothetical protein
MRKGFRVVIALLVLLLFAGVLGVWLWPRPAGNQVVPGPEDTRAVQGPPLFDVAPADGAAVQGTEAWVRFRSSVPARGRALWRRVGDANFQATDAEPGDPLLARVGPLKPGEKYEYRVEATGEDFFQRSGLHTFTVEGGLAFTPATVEQDVAREYDQTVRLTLRNDSAGKVTVAARALARFDDLPADVVGPGSADEPAELAPGKKIELRLAVTAPDATRERYDIPVEAAGAFALARVRVKRPSFKLSLRVIAEDANTLAKTVEIRNEGDTLPDLAVRVVPPNEAEVRLDPAAGHAHLPAGGALRLVATPVLYLEFQSLKAELECAAGGQLVCFPLEFLAPAGKRLLGVRTATQERTSTSDSYCTNRPNTCSILPGPHGHGPTLARASPVETPRPGGCGRTNQCDTCDDPGTLFPGYSRGTRGPGPRGTKDPGDLYDSMDDAAAAVLQNVNPISYSNDKEIAGSIHFDRDRNGYYWTIDCVGQRCCSGRLPQYSTSQTPGHWHTHGYAPLDPATGQPQPLYEKFSSDDLGDVSYTRTEYLGTPKGTIAKLPFVRGEPVDEGKVTKLDQRAPVDTLRPPANPGTRRPTDICGPTHRPFVRVERLGLLEALQRRASFTRAHRGPFAAALDGDAADSAAIAAGWHAGDRVCFAWHQACDEVVFAACDARGDVLTEPHILGKGRWPRLTADGKRTAVAWAGAKSFTVRLNDGKVWAAEIPLDGKEAALAFAPDGPLFAATSTGLWKLTGSRFERVREGSFSQPALAVDGKGRPHVAWRQNSRVVYEGKGVGEGERPSLVVTPDGTPHLAYQAKGGIIVRSRKGEEWDAAEITPAKNPSWPTLAHGTDGPRLTYLGAAEHGPDALWLLRLPSREPVLVPSLAGNVTEAWLAVRFALRGPRSGYRPHDLAVIFNDSWLRYFKDAIPEGRYLFRLDPHQVFTSAGRPVPNRVGVRSWHMNGGHYSTSGDYQLSVRTAWGEHFAFAADAAEGRQSSQVGRRVNHDRPDLAVLANALDLPARAPEDGRIDLPATVANLGEAVSLPARLVLMDGKQILAQADVPPLQPSEQHVVTFRLEGLPGSVEFRIEQDAPDFDPGNDTLTLHLWKRGPGAKAPAARVLPAETAAEDVVAEGEIDPDARLVYRYGSEMRFGLTVVKDRTGKRIDKRLTFSADGSTNNTLVRIDGKDLAFGGRGGKLTEKGVNLSPDTARQARQRSQSVWSAGNIRVTQTLEIVPGKQPVEVALGARKRLLDTCVIRYRIENPDTQPHHVGLRLQIDTLIGSNDGVPFAVPGLPGLITTFKDFRTPAEVPEFIQALEKPDLRDPGTVAHLTLRLPGLEQPGRVSLTHWAGSSPPWDVPVRDIGGDSAAVLYWPERDLRPGERRVVGIAYGLSSFANIAPEGKLALNVEGAFRVGKVFIVLAYVHNPAPGEAIRVLLPDGLELAGGRVHENVPPLPAGIKEGNVLLTWKVRALKAGQFRVTVRSSAGAEDARVVTIAPVRGEPRPSGSADKGNAP